MATVYYRALLEPRDDGGFGIVFPELPGCVSHGDDADHAGRMAAEAVALHLEAMAEDGETVPHPASVDAPVPDWLPLEEGERLVWLLVPVDLPGRAMRVNLSMEEGLVRRVDWAAERRGMSRSAFLAEGARRLLAEA